MISTRSFLCLVLLIAPSVHADSIAIDATAVAITIAPGVGERRYVKLPGLDIDVSVDAVCHDGSAPSAVTLSSADTRQRYSGESLSSATPVRFSIPGDQLPPLWARDFCVVANGPDQARTLTKRAFLSLHGTLSCGSGESRMLTSLTAAVDLDVACDTELFDEAQEPSEDSDSARNSSVRSQD